MHTNESTVLITGANSGIGLEFVRICAKRGHRLVLVGRSKEKLEQVLTELPESVEAHIIVCDLSLPSAALEVWTGIQEMNLKVDFLINNAGVGLFGEYAKTDWVKEEDMMQLNMITLAQLTKLILPGMLERKHGRILNVASVAAFLPGPLMTIYYATKAFVVSFSEGLSEELRGSGVTVTVLCPAPTATGFEKKAELAGSELFKSAHLDTAGGVAECGYDAAMRGQLIVIVGMRNRIQIAITRVIPRAFLARIVAYIQRPSGRV